MNRNAIRCLLIIVTMITPWGCATYNAQKVGPTAIEQAKTEIPEDQLLDVGILVFETKELTAETAKKGRHQYQYPRRRNPLYSLPFKKYPPPEQSLGRHPGCAGRNQQCGPACEGQNTGVKW